MLEMVLDYCASSRAAAAAKEETEAGADMLTTLLQQAPKSLPPKITADLQLDDISALWNASEISENERLLVMTETEASTSTSLQPHEQMSVHLDLRHS